MTVAHDAPAGCDRREVARLVSYPVGLALAGAVLFYGVVPGMALLPSWPPLAPAYVILC